MNAKNKIEALLFASAKRMNVEEISKIANIRDPDKVKASLNELKADYETRNASVILYEEDGFWKFAVKDYYTPMLKKVITKTEMDRPLMETLAVIAWKYPVLQSEVIKIRHNKAYDHLKRLEELNFISRCRFGRTNKINLTEKFFEYFDLPTKKQNKEAFRNVVPSKIKEKIEKNEKEIEEAEKEIEEAKIKKIKMENTHDKKEKTNYTNEKANEELNYINNDKEKN